MGFNSGFKGLNSERRYKYPYLLPTVFC